MVPNKMPDMAYISVIFQPNMPIKRAKATSFTRGDVIKKENVTPNGIPPCTNPINKGTDEQEQKGVTAPNIDANKFSRP